MNNEQTEKLKRLIKEHPDLPVVPFVYYEVAADDYGYWLGKFRECSVGEFAIYNDRYFDDEESLQEEYFDQNEDDYYGKSQIEIDSDIREKTKDMWTKAIIVYIDLPD